MHLFTKAIYFYFSNKTRGRDRKGPPKIKISSADFLMTPIEGTEHDFGPF